MVKTGNTTSWRSFLAHDDDKPVVLIGESQGTAILIHLISTEVDHEPSVWDRLLVAIFVGGNPQVPTGKTAPMRRRPGEPTDREPAARMCAASSTHSGEHLEVIAVERAEDVEVPVVIDSGHLHRSDLDEVEWELAQVCQRRVAGAEVVEAYLDAGVAQGS